MTTADPALEAEGSQPVGADGADQPAGYAPAVARPQVAPAKAKANKANKASKAKPAPRPTVRRGRKAAPLPARRVRRVVRKVDTWTVLRFSVLFYLCLLVVLVVAGCLLWAAASSAGIIHNIENFIKDLFALDSFHFNPANILEGTVFGGLVLVLLGTGINVLAAVIYNLISDVVGGIEVVVLEEDPNAPRRPVI